MSYFGVSLRNGVGLGLGTVPSLTNTPLSYRLAPSLNLSFAGSDSLSPAITFSRTTNATLTNSAGLVAYAPTNLLTFSEQFDNAAWGKTAATVTANSTAAPDSTTTADKVIEDVTTNWHGVKQIAATGATGVFSFYAKAAERSRVWVAFDTPDFVAAVATFNLATGTVQAGTGTIVAAENGWYRCSVVGTVSARGVTVALANDAGTVIRLGDGVSGAYLWGAQLEPSSTATTYNSTTVKNLLGYTENFDNAAWTKSNSFVQTNLLTYSQDFDNAAWQKTILGAGTAPVVVANNAVAPDGSTTADAITFVAPVSGDASFINEQTAATIGVTYTNSVYVKAATVSDVGKILLYRGVAGSGYSQVTLTTEYQRVQVTGVAAGSTVSFDIGLRPQLGGSSGTVSVALWGAQLVQGASAGDYKATYAAAAPVGYTDIYGQPFAQKLVSTATTAEHYAEQSITAFAGTATASIYAKAGEYQWVVLKPVHVGVSGDTSAIGLNLTTLQWNLAGLNRITNYGYVDMGNGFYRVWCTFTTTAAVTSLRARFNLSLDGLGASFAGDGTSGIYIFGAQLSDSASVDPYVYQPVAAPSSVAYYGPRFDYDPVTLQPKGLLIEEQRTNLLLQSGDLSNAAWATKSGTFTANAAVAPDGTTTATSCVATSSDPYVYQSVTLAATTYTMSVWIKGTGVSVGKTGTIRSGANVSPAITITNAWQRITYTFTATAGAVNCGFEFPDGGTTATGDTVYYWGAQLEAGAFATSYIPTVASQVTRAADSASMIGNNFARWYNVNAGSLFIQFQLISGNVAGNNANIVAFEGAAGANMTLHRDSAAGWRYRTNLANLNVTGVSDVASNKTVFAYATSDYPFDAAGGAVQLNTGVGAPPVTTSLLIGAGSNYAAAKPINGTISRIAYYPKRLSNTELQGITA